MDPDAQTTVEVSVDAEGMTAVCRREAYGLTVSCTSTRLNARPDRARLGQELAALAEAIAYDFETAIRKLLER